MVMLTTLLRNMNNFAILHAVVMGLGKQKMLYIKNVARFCTVMLRTSIVSADSTLHVNTIKLIAWKALSNGTWHSDSLASSNFREHHH